MISVDPHYDNDSDTIPFFDDAVPAPVEEVPVPLETTFPLNISLDESLSQHHKKKKKKDKEKVTVLCKDAKLLFLPCCAFPPCLASDPIRAP